MQTRALVLRCPAASWTAVVLLTATVVGCGTGSPENIPNPAPSPVATDPAAIGTGPAVPVAMPPGGAAVPPVESAAAAAAAPGGPGIIPTPAGGGGIVVGDPLEAGDDRPGPRVPAIDAANPAALPPGGALPPGRDPFSPPAGGSGNNPAVANNGAPIANPGLAPDRFLNGGNREEDVDDPPGAGAGATRDFPGAPRRKKDRDDDDGSPANPAAAPFGVAAGGPNRPFGAKGPEEFGRVLDEDGDLPGGRPGGPGGEGANAPVEVKRSTAEEVTTSFLALIAAGDLEQAKTLIGGRATGLLAKLRDGTASDEEVADLREVAAARGQMTSRPKGGTHMQFSVRSDKTVLLIEADQKEEGSSVLKLDMRAAPRKRR